MKKAVLMTALCAALAVLPMKSNAGTASVSTGGGGGSSEAIAVVLIVALGALIFGAGNSGARNTATKKSPDSQF